METLRARLGDRLLAAEPLSRYTAARLGGPADWLYIARDSTEELTEVVKTAWSEDLPVRVLGGGANVLVSDSGVRGLVVINRFSQITFGEWHDGRNVAVSGGTSLTVLAHKCQASGLAGLEWAVSVPGTVGGAIVNNAGAHGGDMQDIVRDVVVLDAWLGPRMLEQVDLAYDYRSSSLKARTDKRFLVLMALLALQPDDPAAIQDRMESFITYRKQTQPPGASLGSIFKNPDGDYAGRLIEAAGLKGFAIGRVQVSPVHANFMINKGGATASDYYRLIRHVQATVFDSMGVELALEIELLGDWSMDDGD